MNEMGNEVDNPILMETLRSYPEIRPLVQTFPEWTKISFEGTACTTLALLGSDILLTFSEGTWSGPSTQNFFEVQKAFLIERGIYGRPFITIADISKSAGSAPDARHFLISGLRHWMENENLCGC
jgi:hypothetical protein